MSSMLDHDLKGADLKPAQGVAGRMFILKDESVAKNLRSSDMKSREQQWLELAKANSDIKGSKFAGAAIGEAQQKCSECHNLHGRAVARKIAEDYKHLGAAVDAKKDGKYMAFINADGHEERGIVSGEGQDLKREGLWIKRDPTLDPKDTRVLETGNFLQGKPQGSFRSFRPDGSVEKSSYFQDGIQTGAAYQYNEKSEPIMKTEYENGKAKEPVIMDPVAMKKAKEEQQAAHRAMNALTMGR